MARRYVHRRAALRLVGEAGTLLTVSLLAACASSATTTAPAGTPARGTATSAGGSSTQATSPTASAGQAGTGVAAATSATPAATELSFMRPSAGPDEDKAYLAMLSGWAQLYPKTKATFISVAYADYETKLLTEIAGGVVCDVVGLLPGDLAVFASKKAIIPLDPYVAKSPALDKGDFFPAHWADGQYQGKQLGIPPDGCALAVAYNVDLFTASSVPEPTPAWTWDDCLKTAQALTKRSGGRTTQFGCAFSGGGGSLLSFLFANDANVIDVATNKATIDRPNAVQTLTYLGDLNNKYHVNPKPAEQSELGANIFLSGRVGMVIANRGQLGTTDRAATFKIAVVPVPKAPATGHSGAQVTPLQLTIETPNRHPDDAWALLEYLASAKSQLDRFTQYGGCPSRRSVATDPRFANSVAPSWVGPQINQVYDQVASAQGTSFVPHHPNWAQISDALAKQLGYLWDGERTADEVAKDAAAQITPLLG